MLAHRLTSKLTTAAPVAAARRFASSFESFQDYEGHRLDGFDLPSRSSEISKEQAWSVFERMATIRRMETKAGIMYRARHIRGFCHLYSGQEAVCVGMTDAFREVDSFITAYRCHGWAYCHGYSVTQILAELFGNSLGCSKGKGGSMHMYGKNFYGGNGIVGAQIPVGAGVGLAHKYLKDGGVNFAFYGDGAANQGQVFEAYNMAKLWNLPVVFVCENNKFAMGTSASRGSASTSYFTRGDYVPGLWVDGMDFVAVKNATEWAINYAQENGPLVLEMETYRYHGHSMSDPDNTYRSQDDIKNIRSSFDPIMTWKKRMVEAGFATPDELKTAEKDIAKSVDAEAEEALRGEPTPLSELTNDIYVEPVHNVRGCDPYTFYNQQA